MKKTFLLIIAGVLAIAPLSCSHSGHSSGTSLVTITVGSGKTASINVQRATMLAKVVNYLRHKVHVPEAAALVPSNVVNINVTVTAADMPPIASTVNVAGLSSVDIVIEVPNGTNRQFVITGYDSIPNIAFWGRAFTDLSGAPVDLPVSMINLGSVAGILWVSTGGNDTTGDGTEQNPYRTISNALSVSTGTPEAIFVQPGTYDDTTETFPLPLNPGSALVGLGENQTTVLQTASNGISGAAGTYIDSLRIFVCDSTGIDDLGSITHINNVILDSSLSCGGGAGDGIVLAADSTVSNTTIKDPFTSGITITSGNPIITNDTLTQTTTYSAHGIVVTLANPIITNTTINGFFADGGGWAITLDTANATVSQCSMSGNGNGISIGGGSPTISGNTISNNSGDGISLSLSGAGAPPTATISGNTIGHNGYGIYGNAVGTSSIHNNKLFCSGSVDFYLLDTAATANGFDLSGNAWDHDTTTLVSGPTITNNLSGCPFGEDICYAYLLTTAPTYTPFNTAVPGGCQ